MRSRQERHQVQISSPHRTFRQRLGAPAHGLPQFRDLLPPSVQVAMEGYENTRAWLVHALTIASGMDIGPRAKLLAALFEVVARSNHPESAEKLEKRASIASLSALMANSTSITVPCFVEAVVSEVLLDPAVRLEVDMWNLAVKSFMGRPDDLSGILSTARLRHNAETRHDTTPDICKQMDDPIAFFAQLLKPPLWSGWLMRCLAEIVWSFPESPDFMINFEKQR